MGVRFEYKYAVPVSQLCRLREQIAPYVVLDPFHSKAGKTEYTVRSIYYDTDKLTSYYEKIEGLPLRKKIRVRAYDACENDSKVFLEIKRKIYSNIDKLRASLPYVYIKEFLENDSYEKYVSEENTKKEKAAAEKFFFYYKQNMLHPVVLIVYDREAFAGRFDSKLRITFDKNIRSSLFPSIDDLYCNDNLKESLKGYFVLEVKFTQSVPSWFKNIIRSMNLTRKAVSKYTLCVDTHNTGFNSKLPVKPGTISNPKLYSFFLEGIQNV